MAKDKCVICGIDSNYDFNTHVDFRSYYVEGAGQLCKDCWENTNGDKPMEYLEISRDLVLQYPNDLELGHKVRELYYRK